jgi:hypothetical protein
LVIGIAAFIAIDFVQAHPWAGEQISHETKEVCFKYTPMIAGIVALFAGLFVGEEYSNKTIRNKIASGYSKSEIYRAYWLVCMAVGGVFYLVFFLIIALPIAPWKELAKYNPNVVADFMRCAFVNLFAILALVSIVVFIAMLVKNRIVGVVAALGCILLLFLASELMFEGIRTQQFKTVLNEETGVAMEMANPEYKGGFMRGVIQTVMDVQPFGQILQVKRGRATDIKGIVLPIYSCLMMVLFGFGGTYFFRKRDLE